METKRQKKIFKTNGFNGKNYKKHLIQAYQQNDDKKSIVYTMILKHLLKSYK